MNTYIPGRDEKIQVYGRTAWKEDLILFWTGSGIEFETDGTEVILELESEFEQYEHWIRVEVNGFSMIRMPLQKGKNQICVFRGMQPETRKRVRLYNEVQPMREDETRILKVKSVSCDGKLYPIEEKKYKLEFIGDSITSGEGLAGNDAISDWVSMIFTTRHHYAVRTAEKLQADFRILSQSGWGTCTSWDNKPMCTLPPYYEEVCGVLKGNTAKEAGAFEKNDFKSWKPDVVIVNLGTNDTGAFENEAWTDPETGIVYKQKKNEDGSYEEASLERFKTAVYDFLKKLRACNPDAYLLWAYGMIGRNLQPYIEETIETYRNDTGDERAAFLLLPDLKPEWAGANNHPGIPAHKATSEVLIQKLSQILEKTEK